MIVRIITLIVLTLLTCSAVIDGVEVDNTLCGMCRGNEVCLNNLMTKLHIPLCVVDGKARFTAKRTERGVLRKILLNSYLRKLR
ncbi:hypothetical protein RB195_026529 [Necator americanus]|uniref:Uncharacterized protein n=2 Tax=Necator americanus TaxID=51031 RepID=A0ABR1EZI3_NECAM|nr:hypothetical protein NECAME_12271 [Necator americanus]ETN75599.1 hypothetical protein NECAME_12271 [Necator americanus]